MKKDIYIAAVNDIKVDSKLVNETARKMKETGKAKKWGYRNAILAASVAILLITMFSVQSIINRTQNGKLAVLIPGKTINLSNGKGTLYINEVGGLGAGKLLVPEGTYSKELSIKEINEYFGRDPFPVVPKDFKPEANSVSIMFKPDGSMFYMSEYRYYKNINDPNSPSISIQLNKDTLPPRDCFYGGVPKESIIGTTKLIIGSIKISEGDQDQKATGEYYEVYTSQFIYNGIGYNITAQRLDGKSFVELLQSIIK